MFFPFDLEGIHNHKMKAYWERRRAERDEALRTGKFECEKCKRKFDTEDNLKGHKCRKKR